MAPLNIVEATIDELQQALASGTVTSVELVALYLRRISAYDCRGPALNSIPVLNSSVFDHAAASDDRRAAGVESVRPLEGIPYTVKDSYAVRGMTVASGSPAFAKLKATDDAFTVSQLRNAGGAVLLGRTNMPPMAYGGMQRGIYGRAESPYNPEYLSAAWWSGSSNGSGVSTTASLAAFGMGEETVSSGRAPASNNALVAYTPSRGWLSIRGNWPLYMTSDVVVPHARTMQDLLAVLDVIAAEDPVTAGDFWRDQPFVQLEKPWKGLSGPLKDAAQCSSLRGLRIAVPEMYIGGPCPPGANPVTTCDEVVELWEEARKHLEALGAEIVLVPDFPCITAYENHDLLPENCPRHPPGWELAKHDGIVAHGWNDFLRYNNDPDFPNLASVNPLDIFPDTMRTGPELKVLDRTNVIHYEKLVGYAEESPLYEVKNLGKAVAVLEGMRKCLLEDWLTSIGCDCVAFPANGDVAPADADINDESAVYARRNGVWYSNGNRGFRHLGIPSVSVPMGVMSKKGMPVNLTFAGRAYDDVNLLRYANAYERKTENRIPPPHTPALESDAISGSAPDGLKRAPRPTLTVQRCESVDTDNYGSPLNDELRIQVEGVISVDTTSGGHSSTSVPELEVTVDGVPVPSSNTTLEPLGSSEGSDGRSFSFKAWAVTKKPERRDARSQTMVPVARDKTMVVILARSSVGGRPSGWVKLL